MRCGRNLPVVAIGAAGMAWPALGGDREYTLINLGKPEGAYNAIGVRLNGQGDVAGWSNFFGEIPNLRAWVWTAEEGFTFLPVPPGQLRVRAIDISDSGIVAGDGGFDSGPAWKFEDGEYTFVDSFEGLPIGVMGG